MCIASLGDISIGCDGCNSMYHPIHVCLGLPDSTNNTIKEYGGRGINLCCNSCRLKGPGSGSNGPQSVSIVDDSRGLDGGASEQALKWLMETIKSLCAAVATFINNMKQMMETVGQSNANPVNPSDSVALRLDIQGDLVTLPDRKVEISW